MTVAHLFRLAWRQSRRSRGRISLFMACIAVGVAAVVIVAGLSWGVVEQIRIEGRRLMAGDVSVEGRRALPSDLDALVEQFAASSERTAPAGVIERSDVRELVSIVAGGTGSQLAELKAVDGRYPFYGDLALDPQRPLIDLMGDDAVVVAPELLTRLSLRVGDELRIGGTAFRIAGVVLDEPDKLSLSFTFGPRVFLSHAGLARTALVNLGSRIEHRALFRLPAGSTAEHAGELERWLRERMPDASYYRVRTFTEAQPSLRRSFIRMGRYLGLVGLLSLLVGGVGVAQVARAWLASRMDDVAVMRCLGVRSGEVIAAFTLQVLAMALVASVIGALLGAAVIAAMPMFVGDLLPAELIRPWRLSAMLRGIGLGTAMAVVFTLPHLVALRRVPPVRVLRREAEPVRAGVLPRVAAGALVLGAVWAGAAWQAESLMYGSWFAVGLAATVALLAGAAVGVSRLARWLPRASAGYRLRHGLAHLSRPGAATIGAVVALGLGVAFVFAASVVQSDLGVQLGAELPDDAPTTFFLDVQSDQWSGLEGLLREHGAVGIDSRPMVTARIAAINDVPVSELTQSYGSAEQPDRTRPRRWALTREQRLTYGHTLPRGNRVIAGAFPADPSIRNAVSVEQEFAEDLGVTVGSTITFDVQGVPVRFTVASLRSVDWRTFGINFFLFAQPGPLDDAPQSRVAVARLHNEQLPAVQQATIDAFPNVTVVHIRDVMDKVLAVLSRLGLAVKALGGFTVAAGVIVLGGTVAASQARRAREVALLKTVGMTRRDVMAVYALEYALTGLVAAVIGIAAGTLLAWAVLTHLMELPWSLSILDACIAAVVTVTLAVIAGLAASARALASRPAEVLRTE